MRHLLVFDMETTEGNNHEAALSPFIKHLVGKSKKVSSGGFKNTPFESLNDSTPDKYVLALKRSALSPVGSRILCMGVKEVYGEETTNHFIQPGDEKLMIERFVKLIRPGQTEFVTFNGRNFDFPFLMFRAAIHGIPLSLPIYPYNGRDGHYDLMVLLNQISNLYMLDSSDWALKSVSLKKWTEYFAIPLYKKSIKNGEINLKTLLEDGNIDVIEEYQMTDVEITYELFKRFAGCFQQPFQSRGGGMDGW